MTNDYQMPLFDRYDLSVEFDRRMNHFRQVLRKRRPEDSSWSDGEVIARFTDTETICPLELLLETTCIEHVEGVHYECAVDYRGDDELWHLYPVDVTEGLLGEIFRGELLMQAIAESEDAAAKIFQARLTKIAALIEQQNERIKAFENALPHMVRGELVRFRGSGVKVEESAAQ